MRNAKELVMLVALLAGCGKDEEKPRLRAVVGASGGTLTGDAGTPFEGVRVVIAPGALAGDTELEVVAASDETPLPLGAEGCGAMFAILPDGLHLAVPARVQLPVQADIVSAYGYLADQVQVWVRDGEGWARHDAVATSSASVEIETSQLGTMAAGVKVTTTSSICTSGCTLSTACTSATGFCVDSKGTPQRVMKFTFVSNGAAIFYQTSDTEAVRYDLGSHITAISTFPVAAGIKFPVNAAVDANGVFWVGTQAGNFAMSFSGGSNARFDPDVPALGVVNTSRGALVRTTQSRFFVRTPFGFTSAALQATFCCNAPALFPDATAPDDFWLEAVHDAFWRFSSTSLQGDRFITTRTPDGQFYFPQFPVVGPDGSLFFRAQDPSGGFTFVGKADLAGHVTSVLRNLAFRLGPQFDGLGSMWLMSSSTPELIELRTDGALISVPLTSLADPTSSDYLGHVPRAMVILADGTLIVSTQSGEVMRVRRGTSS